MEKGRRFVLAGVAVNLDGRLGMLHDTREGTGDRNGSRVISRAWTGETWPNTRKGQKEAAAATLAFNTVASR